MFCFLSRRLQPRRTLAPRRSTANWLRSSALCLAFSTSTHTAPPWPTFGLISSRWDVDDFGEGDEAGDDYLLIKVATMMMTVMMMLSMMMMMMMTTVIMMMMVMTTDAKWSSGSAGCTELPSGGRRQLNLMPSNSTHWCSHIYVLSHV